MTMDNQRENVRVACDHLAPIAEQYDLIISHGNGPQIGLPALEDAAYQEVPQSPLDVLADIDAMLAGTAGTRVITGVTGVVFAPS